MSGMRGPVANMVGIVVSPDGGFIYACDFNSWQGNGKVIAIDRKTREVSVLADGLDQPSTLSLDGPYHLLVANTGSRTARRAAGRMK